MTGLFFLLSCFIVAVTTCEDRDITEVAKKCRPLLSELSTAVLQSRQNYTEVCKVFHQYSYCVEPSIANCQFSQALQQLQKRAEEYVKAPYNCVPYSMAATSSAKVARNVSIAPTCFMLLHVVIRLYLRERHLETNEL